MNRFLFLTLLLGCAITLAGCSDSDDQAIDEDLMDVVWRVDTLFTPDEQITPGPDTLMTIQFTRSLIVSGMVICNNYAGIYEITEKASLSIGVQSWTEIACGRGRLWQIHGFFINALENVTSYEVDEDRLILHDSDRNYIIKLNRE